MSRFFLGNPFCSAVGPMLALVERRALVRGMLPAEFLVRTCWAVAAGQWHETCRFAGFCSDGRLGTGSMWAASLALSV